MKDTNDTAREVTCARARPTSWVEGRCVFGVRPSTIISGAGSLPEVQAESADTEEIAPDLGYAVTTISMTSWSVHGSNSLRE
jgi:hypothetical protein